MGGTARTVGDLLRQDNPSPHHFTSHAPQHFFPIPVHRLTAHRMTPPPPPDYLAVVGHLLDPVEATVQVEHMLHRVQFERLTLPRTA